MKRLNKKGFTMAELLIVVAIIAVLVAIAIPVFTAQLNKSRQATNVANLRAAYAEASADVLDKSTSTADVKVNFVADYNDSYADLYKALQDDLPTDAATVVKTTTTELTFTFNDDGTVNVAIKN